MQNNSSDDDKLALRIASDVFGSAKYIRLRPIRGKVSSGVTMLVCINFVYHVSRTDLPAVLWLHYSSWKGEHHEYPSTVSGYHLGAIKGIHRNTWDCLIAW